MMSVKSPKAHLEQQIRDCYEIIQKSVSKRFLSGLPREERLLQVEIERQEKFIRELLEQYRHLCDRLGEVIPKDIQQIMALYEGMSPSLAKIKETCRTWNMGLLETDLKSYLEESMFKVEAEEGNTLYVHREEVERRFTEFLSDQSEASFFLLIGEAGMGKTTTMWYLLQRFSGMLDNDARLSYPCLFIRGDSITDEPFCIQNRVRYALGDGEGYSIETHIFRVLDRNVLRPTNSIFILFIDAINESPALHLEVRLNELADMVAGTRVKVCLSCRTDFWRGMPKGRWTRLIYQKSAQTASARLEEFTQEEFEQASTRYLRAYRIEGQMSEAAKKICKVPLMMKFFARAYQGRNLQDHVTEIRRAYDIFKDYDRYALNRATSDTNPHLKESLYRLQVETRISSFDEAADRYVRGFLLQVAGLMREERTNRLKVPEALERLERVMRKAYPELHGMEPGFFKNIVYPAILSERIVLEERVESETDDHGARTIRFTFERYFEYVLAQYITRDWLRRRLPSNKIVEEFCTLMIEHEQKSLLTRWTENVEDGQAIFNNIRGSLLFVIQIVEDPEQPFRKLDDLLYLKLLYALISGSPYGEQDVDRFDGESKKSSLPMLRALYTGLYFTWKTLACTVITHLDLAWALSDETPRPVQLDHKEFLRRIIDELGKQRDFVVRWDLEDVLNDLVINKGASQFVWSIFDAWVQRGEFLRKLYAAEILGHLGRTAPGRAITMIQELMKENNFWIRRAVGYSAISLARYLANNGLQDLVMHIIEVIESIALQDNDPFQRGRLLSQLLELECIAGGDWGCLKKIQWQNEHWCVRRNMVEAMAKLVYQATPAARENGLATLEMLVRLKDLSAETRCAIVQALSRFYSFDEGVDRVEHLLQALWQSAIGQSEEPAEHWVLEAVRQTAAYIRLPWPDLPPFPEPSMVHRVAVLYHPDYLVAPLYNHPECGERIEAIVSHIRLHAEDHIDWLALRPEHRASLDDLRKVHDKEYIERIHTVSQQLASQGGQKNSQTQMVALEEYDFEIRPGSYELACKAAGGVMYAANLVGNGKYDLVFALIRPPGHLAGNKICLFNNVAVAVKYYQHHFIDRPRVLIFDCDNHHGLSTFEAFIDDPSVLYFSIHQEGVHPGTGRVEQMGKGEGLGYSFNVPIPEYSDDRVYAFILENLFRPVALRFKPDIIFLSAGFDGHYNEHFCNMALTERSYRYIAQILQGICWQLQREDGRHRGVVAALEGGYSLEALGQCVLHVLDVFSERAIEIPRPAGTPPPSVSKEVFRRVRTNVRTIIRIMADIAVKRNYPLYDKAAFAHLL